MSSPSSSPPGNTGTLASAGPSAGPPDQALPKLRHERRRFEADRMSHASPPTRWSLSHRSPPASCTFNCAAMRCALVTGRHLVGPALSEREPSLIAAGTLSRWSRHPQQARGRVVKERGLHPSGLDSGIGERTGDRPLRPGPAGPGVSFPNRVIAVPATQAWDLTGLRARAAPAARQRTRRPGTAARPDPARRNPLPCAGRRRPGPRRAN